MREIGSEFWLQQSPAPSCCDDNEVCLLSGRTALKFIIDDICSNQKFRKVLLPSYCCESMVEPFAVSGIDVQFYQVHTDHLDYPYENDADAILLIDFFGYTNHENAEIARSEERLGKIVIYDATHKIDGNSTVWNYADYSFCSYRKWFYCNFARVIKKSGIFPRIRQKSKESYIALRDEAAREKEMYFANLTAEKERFLSLFSKAEQMLEEDYIGFAGIPVAFDLYEIVSKHRENAAYLIEGLKEIPELHLWRDTLNDDDTPMFVPILVNPLIRNDLRNELKKEKIYCPIHWPKSTYHGKCNGLYDAELSLVCDQRYNIVDMERMIHVIKGYFNR